MLYDRLILRLSALGLGAVLSSALIAMPSLSAAQDSTPAAGGPPPIPANCSVVAEELMNPRGITVGEDGTVYIAEAGDGGSDPDYATPGAGTPVADGPATTHGDTGRVTAISPDGEQSVVVDGLTSYVFGTEIVGPSGVAINGDTLYVAIGGPGPSIAEFTPQGDANTVVSVDLTSGDVTTLANIGEYEVENNPDPNTIDSNLGGIAVGTDGLVYVADSGGNTIYTIDPESGDLAVLAVLEGLPTDGTPNVTRGNREESDPVPTALVADPEGGVYVGLLTGAILWGTPGAAAVLHVDADGTVTEAATGLNLVVGVALSPNGTLHATELSTNFFAGPPPAPGQVSVIGEDGTPTAVVTDLFLPYGIAFGPDGELYVEVFASALPGDPPTGMLLSCTQA